MRFTMKLMLTLALMSTPAIAANLFVPDQHLTIQAAVDAASPGDRILVDAGDTYAGAIIDKSVKISGAGDATVISLGGPFGGGTAFEITSGADKTEISDLKIDLSGLPDGIVTGIWVPDSSGPPAIKGVIRNVEFVGLTRAIQIRNSSGWIITQNTISELRIPPPGNRVGTVGIWLRGTGNSLVANNTVESNLPGALPDRYVGIKLSATPDSGHVDNNKIVNNTVSVIATGADRVSDIELVQIRFGCDDDARVVANKVISNQANNILLRPQCLADYNVIH